MLQRNSVKICSTCSYKNHPDARRCANPDCGDLLDDMPTYFIPKKHPNPVLSYLKHNKLRSVLAILIIIVIISLSFSISSLLRIHNASTDPAPQAGLGEVLDASGHSIGVNDGSFAPFDIGRSTEDGKQQAAAKLQAGNTLAAISLWQQALAVDSNDAEALIYVEDQRVFTSGEPHITLVAGTAFAPPFPDTTHESILQGIYVAQHEFNSSNHGFKINILIANSGAIDANTVAIARQIVQVAHQDKTVVGVIGWYYSVNTYDALKTLADAKIPLISPQSTSDDLTGISPYFFRVVAPNSVEVRFATSFAETSLHFKHPVIFRDLDDSYSRTLAQGFIDQFATDGYTQVHTEKFKTDATSIEKFKSLIQDAENYQPDGFIFTGRSETDTGLFQDALPTSGVFANLNILAGSGSYIAHPNSKGRWYIVSVAYHNENTAIAKQFAQEYSADFNTHAHKQAGFYGYTLAIDHTIVAYDATALTLQALETLHKGGKTQPAPQDLESELLKITSTNAFQGVSGQIAFGSDSNPIKKALEILFVSKDGPIKLQASSGCFLKGCQ